PSSAVARDASTGERPNSATSSAAGADPSNAESLWYQGPSLMPPPPGHRGSVGSQLGSRRSSLTSRSHETPVVPPQEPPEYDDQATHVADGYTRVRESPTATSSTAPGSAAEKSAAAPGKAHGDSEKAAASEQ